MNISKKKHVGGFTLCELDAKAKCVNRDHWESEKFDVPDALVYAIAAAAQKAQSFTMSDLERAQNEFYAQCGIANVVPPGDVVYRSLMRSWKRKECVEVVKQDRSGGDQYKWNQPC